MSSERIRTAIEDPLIGMGSCVAFALVAVGFQGIPIENFLKMADMNRRKFGRREQIGDISKIIMQESGYDDWDRTGEIIADQTELSRISNHMAQGHRITLKVDYGDGRNSHYIGVITAFKDAFRIGGDLRFIGSHEPYTVISQEYLS